MYRIAPNRPNLFSHIIKIPDDRLPKRVVFGITEGSNIGGRPRKRWTDNVEEWCNNYLHVYIYHGRGRRDKMANGIEFMDLDGDDDHYDNDDDRIYLYSIIKAGSELTVLGC